MQRKSRSGRSGRSSRSSKIQYFGSNPSPNVVGKSRIQALSDFFNEGFDYRISYVSSGATPENNDTVAAQEDSDAIVNLSVYRYEAPSLVNISFDRGEYIYYYMGANNYPPLGTNTYDVPPYSGQVIGDLPSDMTEVQVGSTITLPSFGNLQRAERTIRLSPTRSQPDILGYMPLTHWTDGTRRYLPGSSYTVGDSNVTFRPGWSPGWRTANTTGGSTLSAAPGSKIYIYMNNNTFEGFSPLTVVQFRGRINGTTGGTTSVTYPVTEYELVDYDTLEITVPEIPATSNYLISGRYATVLWLERSSTFNGLSRESRFLTNGSTDNGQHRFITIL